VPGHRLHTCLAIATLIGSSLASVAGARPAAASDWIIYVDGKTGYDAPDGNNASTTWGRSTAQPFKTIERALEETRHGAPTAIRIKGYTDYVYHETIDRAYLIRGGASAPVTIGAYTAADDAAAAGIRPIVDGGLDVGTTGWHRPNATSYPHVWCKTWRPPGANLITGQAVPPGYDSSLTTTRQDRLYLDDSQPLNRPATAPTMAQLNAQPYSESWDGSKTSDNLCVHLGRWDGVAVNENPSTHHIVVPWYRGIVLAGGSSYVTVRDLRIRHTVMGVGFSVAADAAVGKAHDNTALNVDASYNYRMGFWTAGDDNTFDHVSGSRNSIQLIKLDAGTYSNGTAYGAQHNIIRNARGIQNLSHGVKLYGKLVQGNTVAYSRFEDAGIPVAAHSADQTQGIQLSNGASNNVIRSNVVIGGDVGLELYQYDSQGGPLAGNTVTANSFEHLGVGVFLWDNRISASYGTGPMSFSHNVYYDTQTGIGGNGTTSGKVFDHETIFHAGFQIGPTAPSVDKAGVRLFTGSITIRNSIVDDTNGPSICTKSGATVSLAYSDTYRWRNDPRSSMPHGTYCYSTASYKWGAVAVGSGVVHVSPGYSTDPASASFLVVPGTSAIHASASDGTALGAE
jgi:hypothetical protein